jgi:hypothetical protein
MLTCKESKPSLSLWIAVTSCHYPHCGSLAPVKYVINWLKIEGNKIDQNLCLEILLEQQDSADGSLPSKTTAEEK